MKSMIKDKRETALVEIREMGVIFMELKLITQCIMRTYMKKIVTPYSLFMYYGNRIMLTAILVMKLLGLIALLF